MIAGLKVKSDKVMSQIDRDVIDATVGQVGAESRWYIATLNE
jgi:hypothetical protein